MLPANPTHYTTIPSQPTTNTMVSESFFGVSLQAGDQVKIILVALNCGTSSDTFALAVLQLIRLKKKPEETASSSLFSTLCTEVKVSRATFVQSFSHSCGINLHSQCLA
jgi:hypothetical protein